MLDTMQQVPVIDIAPARSTFSHGKRQVAEHVAHAYSRCGFSYLINHGIDEHLLARTLTAARAFHALEHTAKARIALNEYFCGFIPMDFAHARKHGLKAARRPNHSDSFVIMRRFDRDGVSQEEIEQWPTGIDAFRETVTEYSAAMIELGRRLARVFALAMNAQANILDEYFRQPTTTFRMLHYPPQPKEAPDDLFGSAPHTDYGFLTVLLQDSVGGLQIRGASGAWIDAPPVPGALILNSGDLLQRWSNGRYPPTQHRVINHSASSRYSIAFFFDPDTRLSITPLPGCIAHGQEARFEPVTYGEYLDARLKANIYYEREPASARSSQAGPASGRQK